MRVVSRQPSDAEVERIRPLDVLPVFLDLKEKRCVVAGGSEAAAWKAELLAAAGASVEVMAPRDALSAEMQALLSIRTNVRHEEGRWSRTAMKGAVVAILDTEDDAEARTFEAAARNAGAACNVIDRPAYCHFQFGSIVNRSPVVIGISTSGAAPILGQAVRRRIETLLPPTLAEWAKLARTLRNDVLERLAAGPQRRAFWERLVDRAFGPAPTPDAVAELSRSLCTSRSAGHVTFVGAGPGDAELLTLKAVRALQAADVILFDDLVSDEVLELARREAKQILVGKRAGRPSCKQHEINDMMVALAKAGRRVVRLKSGDPMVFGRAGEEIEALRQAGISYDAVPGVTAAIAMASALGVSLTHRDHAKSVRFVTGHSRKGGLPEDVDWRAIADPSATTVFYMAGRTAAEISARLIGLGLPPASPVAIAASLGRSDQILRQTTLRELGAAIEDIGISKSLILGIGEVFAAAQAMSMPLAGQVRA